MARDQEMIAAVQAGAVEKVRELLDQERGLAAARDGAGVSAIMHALYRQRKDIVEMLAKAKPDLDIFEAAALGNTTRVARLIEGDSASVNSYSADGFTALHLACFFSQPSAAKLLLERGADPAAVAKNVTQVTPLHSAASGRNMEAVRQLLAHGAPVNARQQHGWTALHSAAQNGSEEMVDALLKHGADVRAANEEGVTPAAVAEKAGHTRVAQSLRAKAGTEARHDTRSV